MLTLRRTLLSALFLLIISVPRVAAQSSRLFDVDRELTSSLINNLYQDAYGMLWVATEEGLNRYDGNKFRQYRHIEGDESSLCSNFVNSLFENSAGELIVCTNRGMQLYNPATGRFGALVKDHDGRALRASVVEAVRRLNGDYWIIGDSVRVMPASGSGSWGNRKLAKAPASCRSLKHVHCGISDSGDNLWLSLNERGLVCLTSDNKMYRFFGSPGDPVISCMAIGKDGQLYLGSTNQGLLRYNPDTRSFDRLSPSTGREIKSLYVDSNGQIMQATDGTGIMIYDPGTGTTSPMHFGNRQVNSAKAKTHRILRDDCDNLWIGMFQTGVMILPASSNAFAYIGPNSERYNVIGDNCISSIFKSSDGTIWVGADNDGIYALNPDMTLRSHFINDEISVPMTIFEDSRRNLWVGTYLSGVGIMDRTTGRMQRIRLPEQSGVQANMCFAITEDRDHNVWLGMMHSGLIRYNLETGAPSVDFPWRKKVDSFIASLYYSPTSNNLYIGTYSGLQVVSNLSNANAKVERMFDKMIIHSIDEDSYGTIWLGTSEGLLSFDPRTGKQNRYGTDSGLPLSTVYALRCDGGYVWMSLNSGIARFDTTTGNIATFFTGDGLLANEFYKNSVFRDSDGHIFFGGTGGITHFNPRDINNPGRQWTPRIVDIYTHGEPITGDIAPFAATKFNLRRHENSFSVEFGTRELGRPETVRFAYSIDGKPWETLPPNTYTVNFYDLDPGEHTLKFKTIDGATESPENMVSLSVAYPWYSAPWIRVVYAILTLMLIWGAVHAYNNRVRNRTCLVELQHSDQLNEARVRSYVNISHEIRTPMSLIISPLQKLITNDKDPSRQRQYHLIMRNAKRVLRLIDELMDVRKIEKHQMKLTFRNTPLVPFIQDVCDTFAHTVADKRQELTFHYSDEEIAADVDVANFDKILMNLVSNAVKYTPVGGEIRIDLTVKGNDAVITVTDTGQGIPDEDKKRIFERFYQVKGNESQGSGVGLHLAHQLAALHGGELTVTDNPDSEKGGTRFTLRVPLTNEQCEHSANSFMVIRKGLAGAEADAGNQPADTDQLNLPSEGKRRRRQANVTVLIVEDDEEIRNYLVSEISPYYKVVTSTNGREALDEIFSSPPALIVSDVMMPEIDGLQLTRTVKQNINLNNIPVVLVSALVQEENQIAAIDAGADAYFTKPFNIELLRERMAALIKRYKELEIRFSGNQVHDDKINNINVESADEKLIRRALRTINKNIKDPDFSVEKLALEVGMSRVHLHRRLKELTNQSPSDFIRNTRLRQAAKLLRTKNLTIAEAAFATGFNNSNTFSLAFKRLYGMNPSDYEDSMRNSKETEIATDDPAPKQDL